MKKKIDPHYPKLLINNIPIDNRSPTSVLEILLLCINFQYSPIDTIQKNIQYLLDIAEQYFIERKKISSLDKTEKVECTRIMKTINVWRKNWPFLDREAMITAYWNFRMRNEKLSLLSGFGVAQIESNGEGGFKVRTMGVNPEKQTLRSLPPSR